ncbi:hypothetical protein ACFO0N_13445 [Halobium salinum]|uniref:DUF8009 domain-containing protein n=1 Tax=Halobium salinum TaxID=1364940 RepID=A0ABD5PE22_9EURY|nr:hypothetical protein [Halobium salinum]
MPADAPLSDDPERIRSVAVTVDDLVTALEAATRGGRDAVLRITPPFPARARARLHVAGGEGPAGYDGSVDPIHLDPRRLVDGETPAYPEVDETADRLEADGDAVTEGALYEAHAEAVAEWRRAVRDHVVDRVALPLAGGDDADPPDEGHVVDVKRLG